MAPAGIIHPSELPDGWGLAEVHERSVRKVVQAPQRNDLAIAGRELPLLLSAARRMLVDRGVEVLERKVLLAEETTDG